MIPPPSTRCLLPSRHAGGSTPPCGSTREEASDRTGRKAEFVERDHATGVTAQQDIDRGSPVRGAAGKQSGAEPRPTHSFGVPVIADTCSRKVRHLGWVFGTQPAERRAALGPVMPEMAGFRIRPGRDQPHRGIGAVVDLTQQWARDLAKCRQLVSDTRRFHPARMHAVHADVAAFRPSRPRVGQHDLHIIGASSGCTAMNRPADPLERGASVDELLDRAATVANGMSPEAGSPYRPNGV
jgi:hypothetical protein